MIERIPVTPFCSCSAVPIFIGFAGSGISLGVTFSFIVSSPMKNEVAVVILWGLFVWKIVLLYITAGRIPSKEEVKRFIEEEMK